MTTTRTEKNVAAKAVNARIQTEPIDVQGEFARAGSAADGAVSVFVGRVRDHDPQAGGQVVTGIEYTAHPDAQATLGKQVLAVTEAVAAGVAVNVTAIHRIGHLEVGDVALLVLVSGPHREPAMTLVPAVVERIKETLPVWKRQLLQDGTSQWSNLP